MRGQSLFGLMALVASLPKGDMPVKVPSHKIETKKEKEQLSKQAIQKLRGKKARKNRGKKRQ